MVSVNSSPRPTAQQVLLFQEDPAYFSSTNRLIDSEDLKPPSTISPLVQKKVSHKVGDHLIGRLNRLIGLEFKPNANLIKRDRLRELQMIVIRFYLINTCSRLTFG